jgi:hypothetical protein
VSPAHHAGPAAGGGPVARVVRRLALVYADGAHRALDRPPHVRAASALAWVAPHTIAVVQDDARFVAIVDTRSFHVTAVPLPPGPDGARLHGDDRGTKHLKLDLEAGLAVEGAEGVTLYAFGSGSTNRRESVAVVHDPAGAAAASRSSIVPLPRFYAALRAAHAFAGSELNVEGALVEGGTLRLFNRGNGAPRDGLLPVDATCDVPWAGFLAHLADPNNVDPPLPQDVVQYDLGSIDGVRLTFTDAVLHDGAVLFCAAAEASPDAVEDGPVSGSALGVVRGGTLTRTMPLLDADGTPLRDKVEGIAVDPADARRLWLVADHDDVDRASDLLECTILDNSRA